MGEGCRNRTFTFRMVWRMKRKKEGMGGEGFNLISLLCFLSIITLTRQLVFNEIMYLEKLKKKKKTLNHHKEKVGFLMRVHCLVKLDQKRTRASFSLVCCKIEKK